MWHVCVNPDENYCKVKAADGYTYYMAEALLDKVLGGMAEKLVKEEKIAEGTPAYEILETYKGKELEGKEYEPLLSAQRRMWQAFHRKDITLHAIPM